ncbi:hypothetical protein [Aquimarina litoralis]|uniref:hypothetical protein n=1 Tax=Aquimarina litoralis TaxID=584605 RepID=UPI0031E3CE4D
MQKLLKNNSFKAISKASQKSINGGNLSACEQAISLDGTLCLCIGFVPKGNICVAGPAL